MSNEHQKTLDSNLYGDIAVKGMPWHAVGKSVDGLHYFDGAIPLATVREFMGGYDVEMLPVSYKVAGPESDYYVDVPNKGIVVGTGHANLGNTYYVGGMDSYSLPNVGAAVDTLTEWTGEGSDLHVSGAGALRNGGRLYVSIATGELRERHGVQHASYFTLALGVDGSMGRILSLSTVLPVCDNTLAMAWSEGAKNGELARIKNTKFANDRTDAAAKLLGIIRETDDAFDAEIDKLIGMSVSDVQFQKIVELAAPITNDTAKAGVTRAENTRAKLANLWNNDARVSPWKGTAFGALQALNTFSLWEKGTRGDTVLTHRIADDMLSGKLAKDEAAQSALVFKVLANA